MNIWVEWYRYDNQPTSSKEKMKESVPWKPPSPTKINRRYFDEPKDAAIFAARMNDRGYFSTVKRDGMGY